MDFWPVYLVNRFFYRIGDFFHHWYVDGSRTIGRRYMQVLRDLDQTFAMKITFKHFFEPLYKDYSIMGRILGVIFRTGRVIFGAAVFAIASIVFLFAYLIWLAVPAAIVFFAAKG